MSELVDAPPAAGWERLADRALAGERNRSQTDG